MTEKPMTAPSDPAGGAHTPGPWEYDGHAQIVRADQPHLRVAFLPSNVREDHPDGYLIAAAPLLLEALREVREWIDNWSPNFVGDDEWPATAEKMRAALAAAQGCEMAIKETTIIENDVEKQIGVFDDPTIGGLWVWVGADGKPDEHKWIELSVDEAVRFAALLTEAARRAASRSKTEN